MKLTTVLPAGLAALMLCVNQTDAHSWVEKLLLIASNGTFVGTPGYPRGFVPRSSPGFSDFVSENQIPPDGRPTATEILPTDLMCKAIQGIGNQTAGNPALLAAPGDNVALIYQENGHVTLLDRSPTKPVGSGTIFIYGTKHPSNSDTYLGIHRVWNTQGTGGDKRGKLLATRPFDDGQCYQNNTSPLAISRRDKFGTLGNDLPCQSDVQLPQDAGTSGKYTLYWVWEWPTLDDVTGKVITNQSYTTCMDIVMTPKKLAGAGSFNSKQLVDSRAIERELSTAFLVNPTAAEQLTTTKGVAGSRPTSPSAKSPSTDFGLLKTASNGVGGTVTVTVTAEAEARKTVTITTAVCNCDSTFATSPSFASTPSVSSSFESPLSVSPFLPASPPSPGQQSTTAPAASTSTDPPSVKATTNTEPATPQNTAGAGSTPSSAHPVVQPFLNSNSVFIPGSSATTMSTASDAPTNPLATAAKRVSQASNTTPSAQCTNTGAGSRRRRRNGRGVT